MDFNFPDIRAIASIILMIFTGFVVLTGIILTIIGINNKKRKFYLPGIFVATIPTLIFYFSFQIAYKKTSNLQKQIHTKHLPT